MANKKITIVIVTKKRPRTLARVLASLVLQTQKPHEIVIIDNDINKSASYVTNDFSEDLNIFYFNEKKQGVPNVRNRALDVVKSTHLAFIDDDCVVDKNWVKNTQQSIENNSNYSYFVGNSFLLNTNSTVAVSQHTLQRYWFLKKIKNGGKTSPFNVDTKNIIFKISDLKKNNIRFDTDINIGWFDSADVDVGFCMESKQMSGLFLQNSKVWHEEKTKVFDFFKKGYYRGRLAFMVANKWEIKDEFVYLPFRNIFIYLKSIKGWKEEYGKYSSVVKNTNIFSFILVKFYERIFLYGYLTQANLMNKKLD